MVAHVWDLKSGRTAVCSGFFFFPRISGSETLAKVSLFYKKQCISRISKNQLVSTLTEVKEKRGKTIGSCYANSSNQSHFLKLR